MGVFSPTCWLAPLVVLVLVAVVVGARCALDDVPCQCGGEGEVEGICCCWSIWLVWLAACWSDSVWLNLVPAGRFTGVVSELALDA